LLLSLLHKHRRVRNSIFESFVEKLLLTSTTSLKIAVIKIHP
jgi:hypothetical protein